MPDSPDFVMQGVFVTEHIISPSWHARSYTLTITDDSLTLLEDGADPSSAIVVPTKSVKAKKVDHYLGVKLFLGDAGNRVLSWGAASPGLPGPNGIAMATGGVPTGVAVQRSKQVLSALAAHQTT
jgi:hypothetical protein